MKKFSIVFVSTLFFLTSFVVFWGCTGAGGGTKQEAENAAMDVLNKYLVKCDGVYTVCVNDRYNNDIKNKWVFEQYKKALIHTQERTTEADRLNGYEWKGVVQLKFDVAYRSFIDGQWSQWSLLDVNAKPEGLFALRIAAGSAVLGIDVQVEKKKGGQWMATMDTSGSPYSCEKKPITCTDVPGTKENDVVRKQQEQARQQQDQEKQAREKEYVENLIPNSRNSILGKYLGKSPNLGYTAYQIYSELSISEITQTNMTIDVEIHARPLDPASVEKAKEESQLGRNYKPEEKPKASVDMSLKNAVIPFKAGGITYDDFSGNYHIKYILTNGNQKITFDISLRGKDGGVPTIKINRVDANETFSEIYSLSLRKQK